MMQPKVYFGVLVALAGVWVAACDPDRLETYSTGGAEMPGQLAAEVALAMVRVSMDLQPVVSDRVKLSGHQRPFSLERAAEVLASLPKPLQCTGSLDGDYMQVSCTVLTETNVNTEYEHRLKELRAGKGVIGSIASRLEGRESGHILLLAGTTRLKIPFSVLQEWVQSYVAPPGLTLGGRPPSSADTDKEAKWVVVASRLDAVGPSEFRRFVSGLPTADDEGSKREGK